MQGQQQALQRGSCGRVCVGGGQRGGGTAAVAGCLWGLWVAAVTSMGHGACMHCTSVSHQAPMQLTSSVLSVPPLSCHTAAVLLLCLRRQGTGVQVLGRWCVLLMVPATPASQLLPLVDMRTHSQHRRCIVRCCHAVDTFKRARQCTQHRFPHVPAPNNSSFPLC